MGHRFSFCQDCDATRDCDTCEKLDVLVEVVRCRDCKYEDECIRRIEFIGRDYVKSTHTNITH